MDSFLNWFLPVYVLIYIALTFGWRTWLVWRRTGINPYALGKSDNAHDTIGRMFGMALGVVVAAVLIDTLWPAGAAYLVPITYLDGLAILKWIGLALLLISLAWTVVAQAQMGRSWRIGIDAKNASALVISGIFRLSRNPIFLGMRVTLLGLFLAVPDAVTLAALVLGEALVQIQVRLEEEFLAGVHGEAYRDYCRRTRRWL